MRRSKRNRKKSYQRDFIETPTVKPPLKTRREEFIKKVLIGALHPHHSISSLKKDRKKLSDIEDNRREFERFPKKISGVPAEYGEHQYKNRFGDVYSAIAFDDPKRTIVCKRRSERRRALFQKKKIGKGKGVTPLRKYTEWSKVRCK